MARERRRDSPRPERVSRPSSFAKQLLAAWRHLGIPNNGDPVLVGASGGADSTALLFGLDELVQADRIRVKILVAHYDHGLRTASRADAAWVAGIAEKLNYRFLLGRGDVKRVAAEAADNLEQAARRARYAFFERRAKRWKAAWVLTGHTLDDQAETVLLRLMRGSAAEGLGGIESVRPINYGSTINLARPLISWARRADTQRYCAERGIEFRVDSMNEDLRFARVKVRNQLLPLMESFNNKIVEALGRTANLLREDSVALSTQADELLDLASCEVRTGISAPLRVEVLRNAPSAVRRRALRLWLARGRGDLRRLEMVHLMAVDKLLFGSRGGRTVELPNGTRVVRKQGRLELNGKKS